MAPPGLLIGFDARLAGPAHAGIGRYSEELLKRLLSVKQIGGHPVTWIVWVRPNHDLAWLEDRAAVGEVQLRRVDIPHYSVAEQSLWTTELLSAKLDLLHVPHFNVPIFYRRPFIVTIHDLLWHTQRDARATTLSPIMHFFKHTAYSIVSESAIKRAQAVVVPSRLVKEEVARLTGRRSEVIVTYESIPEIYRSAVKADRKTESFIIYTGSLYPHKNVEVILEALKLLPKLQLRIASTRGVFTDRLLQRARAIGVDRQVEFLGFVPDEELIGLYRRARALIQPSKSEGFGLTGLEAMAAGCPVIASDIPIFKEIYSDYARFFDPTNPAELAALLRTKGPSVKELSAARTHALTFSWDRMADETLHVYETALARLGKL